MAIRLTGLTSGLDTDSIVQELVSAYSLKTQKYEKASTKLTWKQDIWKNLNTKIYGLYTNVSNLRYSSAYSLRKTTVSDNTKATVTASATAVTGTQTLKINKTAQSSYITGGDLGSNTTSETKLSELGYSGTGSTFKVKNADNTSTKIEFTKDTTVGEVVNKLKEAGLNASFDENNHRLFVSSKKSGVENDFSITASSIDGLDALSCLGLDVPLVKTVKYENGNEQNVFTEAGKEYQEMYDFYYSTKPAGTDMITHMKDLYEKYEKLTKENKDYKELINQCEQKESAWLRDIEIYTAKGNALTAVQNISEKIKNAGVTGLKVKDVSDMLKAVDGMDIYTEDNGISADFKAKIQEIYKANYGSNAELFDEDIEAIAGVFDKNYEDAKTYVRYNYTSDDSQYGYTILESELEDTTHRDLNDELYRIQVLKDNNSTEKERLEKLLSDNSEFTNKYGLEFGVIKAEAENKEQINARLEQMAVRVQESAEILENADGRYSSGSATKVMGCDAEIELNGVVYTSADNNFTINGLSITALAATQEAITVTTNIDTQGIYDKVKDFLTEYNNIINEITKLYNADSASDYEPLTDDEKEAMSDEQIEKWETKIKDSLLRRDTTLSSIMTGMINAMAQTFEINGKTMSLSTFGIHTLGYLNAPENENYAYHIDGDEDDENTSGNEEKLMAAIMENPDEVEEFMKQLCSNLYKTIDDKMKSTDLSSAYKVYNDKEMDKELARYEEAISKWEQKVKDKEDYYYNKFSAMETALSKLESQTSSISSLLGS